MAADVLLFDAERTAFVQMAEPPAEKFNFASEPAINRGKPLLRGIEQQRPFHVMEDLFGMS